MISDYGIKCFDQVPTGNVELRLVHDPDPCHFLRQSDEENFPDFLASMYGDPPAGALLPFSNVCSSQIRLGKVGKNAFQVDGLAAEQYTYAYPKLEKIQTKSFVYLIHLSHIFSLDQTRIVLA